VSTREAVRLNVYLHNLSPSGAPRSKRALLHDTRDILVTQESEQRRNAAIGARAIRLATECSVHTSSQIGYSDKDGGAQKLKLGSRHRRMQMKI